MSLWRVGHERQRSGRQVGRLRADGARQRAAICSVLIVTIVVAAYSSAFAKGAFKPFRLKTVEGSPMTLQDLLSKVTLVTFFFPTCG